MNTLVPNARGRVAGGLNVIFDLLLLHFCFLVASIPVVTVVPAALALQRSIDDNLLRQETSIVSTFVKHFRWGLRRFWVTSLVVLAYSLLLFGSIYLWSSFAGGLRIFGLTIVVAFGLLAGALYLGGLAWSSSVELTREKPGKNLTKVATPAWRQLWNGARERLARQPVGLVLCTLSLAGWLLLMVRILPLTLFGFGLVPALLVYALNRMHAAKHPEA